MVLTCCGSRVSPEIIFDQKLGELFVVRLAGDVADKMAIGSLEIGAEHLHASLLVVMSHQHCGGVQAACSMKRGDSANLKAIIKAVRTSGASAGLSASDDELCGAEKQNARYIAHSLLDKSAHLRDCVHRGHLTVVTAYYHIDSGAAVIRPPFSNALRRFLPGFPQLLNRNLRKYGCDAERSLRL